VRIPEEFINILPEGVSEGKELLEAELEILRQKIEGQGVPSYDSRHAALHDLLLKLFSEDVDENVIATIESYTLGGIQEGSRFIGMCTQGEDKYGMEFIATNMMTAFGKEQIIGRMNWHYPPEPSSYGHGIMDIHELGTRIIYTEHDYHPECRAPRNILFGCEYTMFQYKDWLVGWWKSPNDDYDTSNQKQYIILYRTNVTLYC